jgi:hypothetical protein
MHAAAEAEALMVRGTAARAVGETRMNRASSRSHSVFTLALERRSAMRGGGGSGDADDVHTATLQLVDLAGSERPKVSGVTGTALSEATDINVSLTALGRVIRKVRSRTVPHSASPSASASAPPHCAQPRHPKRAPPCMVPRAPPRLPCA